VPDGEQVNFLMRGRLPGIYPRDAQLDYFRIADDPPKHRRQASFWQLQERIGLSRQLKPITGLSATRKLSFDHAAKSG
jgi:hypothetical protein